MIHRRKTPRPRRGRRPHWITIAVNDAANALYAYVWGKVCDCMLELSNPCCKTNAPEAAETRQTLKMGLGSVPVCCTPDFMPYITEEGCGRATANPFKTLVLHGDWPDLQHGDMLGRPMLDAS